MSDLTADELLDRRYILTVMKGVDGEYHAMARHVHETTEDVIGCFDTIGGKELIRSSPGKPSQRACGRTVDNAIANLLYQLGDGRSLK